MVPIKESFLIAFLCIFTSIITLEIKPTEPIPYQNKFGKILRKNTGHHLFVSDFF